MSIASEDKIIENSAHILSNLSFMVEKCNTLAEQEVASQGVVSDDLLDVIKRCGVIMNLIDEISGGIFHVASGCWIPASVAKDEGLAPSIKSDGDDIPGSDTHLKRKWVPLSAEDAWMRFLRTHTRSPFEGETRR